MLRAITDHLIFAAPESTYDESCFQSYLCWLPWNDAVPAPGGRESGGVAGVCRPGGAGGCRPNCSAISAPPRPATVPALPCLWFGAKQAATVVIYFHANAEDLGVVFPSLQHLHDQLQVSVLAVEYPGYGLLRKAKASEANTLGAALVALRYMVDEIGVAYQQVVLLGRSLGSGPAVHLASRFPVGGLITVNAFVSVRAAVESQAGATVAALAFREAFENERLISNVSCPSLFIHARSDRLVPTEHSVRLFRRCRARKLLVTPDGMEHNSHMFADPSFLVLPVIHFFHFPSYRTAKPPRLPEEVFRPPVHEVVKTDPCRGWVLPFCGPVVTTSQGGAAGDDGFINLDDIAVPAGEAPLGSVEVNDSYGARESAEPDAPLDPDPCNPESPKQEGGGRKEEEDADFGPGFRDAESPGLRHGV